ncbi:MAG: hypothetical protein EZS28_023023 [Streblomastix strix]|uniref:Uncharacterized protein n=1 Tax=Streblomastix strix TaxID=222440 RepID=A0A5J4VFU6_9EUKA|nr:MAG: hypothetical protein EZS28_023023 [Streblomastix strix]
MDRVKQNDRYLFNNSLSGHFENKTSGENHLRFEHCPALIASIPAVDTPSKVEQQAGMQRWNQFTAEMMKPAPYDSMYKTQFVKLDGMRAINLEIRLREQIPFNIQIDDYAALFFNPYEGLTHTLDDGPVNDGILMAQLFISKRYNIVFLCDATHHETRNTSSRQNRKEKDDKSEVLAFQNAKKKKAHAGQKITAVKGITNEISFM